MVIVENDGCDGVSFGVGDDGNSPEHLAVCGIHSGEGVGGESHDLERAGEFGEYGRAVGGFVVERFPEDFARDLVETDEGSAVGAADGDDDLITVDEAGTVMAAPYCGPFQNLGADELDSEIGFEMRPPQS